MVTEDMLGSVSRFIDAVTRRIDGDGKVSPQAIEAAAGLCTAIVEHRPDNLADKELEFIIYNAARMAREGLEGGN